MCKAHNASSLGDRIKKRGLKFKIRLCFLILALIPTLQTTPAFAIYSDIVEGDPYYLAIKSLTEKEIINGYTDGTYKADNRINRAETLKILTLASGIFTEEEIESIDNPEKRPFTDTPIDSWYTKYLKAAKDNGIVNGYPDGSFKPGKDINLAETLKIFLESFDDLDYSKTEEFLFDDTPLNEWFTKYTAFMAEKGLINIYSTNTVNPSQMMSRGYLAEIIYRFLKSKDGYKFGKATWYGAAVQGNGTASGEIFDKDKLTAAHQYLPFGSIVEVTNLANGKSVNVKINDRGPYGPGRVIDLSSGAFTQIASLGTGVIYVQYRPVHLP